MNSFERLQSVIHFQKTDRPPVVPELIGVTATLADVPVVDYVTSGEIIAALQIEAQSKIGHDAVFAASDLCVEAEAVGCSIEFPEHNYPFVRQPVIGSIRDLDSLEIPDPLTAGRMPEIIKATRLMKNEVEGVVPVFAHVIGPITLAGRIMDVEKMLYMIVDNPDQFRAILEYCRQVSQTFALELVKAGADGILMFDPVASMSLLPPKIFREFEAKPVRSVFRAIKSANPDVLIWYSVAGPLEIDFSAPLLVGPDIFTIDYVVPLDIALKRSNAMVINGNIKPVLFLDGGVEEITAESTKLLSMARRTERFILGSGCEIPLNSKLENIKSLVAVATREAGASHKINSPTKGSHAVTILPHGKKVYVQRGSSLLDAIHKANIAITSYCDRTGSCGKCVVEVGKGDLSPLDRIEALQLHSPEKRNGKRLACMAKTMGPVEIYIPYFTRLFKFRLCAVAELESQSIKAGLDMYGFEPDIASKPLDMTNFNEQTPISYQEGLLGQLGSYKIDSRLIDNFASILSSGKKMFYAIVDKERREVIKFSASGKALGLALDIGTTTITAYVHDLDDGKLICAGSVENPQTEWGLDIISRVACIVKDPSALPRMQRKLIEGINNVIDAFCKGKAIDSNDICFITVVSNPVITHLLLGLNPVKLSQTPYKPTISLALSSTVEALWPGMKIATTRKCRVNVLPSVAGFVGADTVAGLVATGMSESAEISLFIDIGTNGEVVIGNRDSLICASVAAGPAFESVLLTSGTAYQSGVIYKLKILSPDKIHFDTVDDTPPIGLCGSGVIDVIAEFSRHGIINDRGRFINQDKWPQIRGNVFVLAPREKTAAFNPICITSGDIEEIQKAKSAFKTSVTLLMRELGVSIEEVSNVYISGSFGYSINIENARKIGMIPDFPCARYSFLYNSAGQGARIAMLSGSAWRRASQVAERTKHVNLANHADFNNLFVDNMLFT